MNLPWFPQPSPDGIKPTSWRIRLVVQLGLAEMGTQSGFFYAVLDTGALWTTFTEDFAQAIKITDITSGSSTTVRWFGTDHPAWQHRVRLTIAVDPHASDTLTPEPIDVLFIRRFPHRVTGRLLSLAVLGMDAVARLRFTLDGPAAMTRF